ncbi:MAG: YiiD C-terminal domain-containing protein [Flavobacteriales bacterium]
MLRRKTFQFVMNIFPPLFFNRIILKEVSENYTFMKVKIRRSFLNMNFHRSIFGGTIFSAFDPYFPTMYYNTFAQKNRKLEIWMKSANIKYKRPATTHLYLEFKITEEDIQLAEKELNEKGKFEKWHTVQAINNKGIVCAEAEMLVYLRDNKVETKIGF